MINRADYEIVGTTYHRHFYPNTFHDSRFVVRHKEKHRVVGEVASREEGNELIDIIYFLGKEKVTFLDFIDLAHNPVIITNADREKYLAGQK